MKRATLVCAGLTAMSQLRARVKLSALDVEPDAAVPGLTPFSVTPGAGAGPWRLTVTSRCRDRGGVVAAGGETHAIGPAGPSTLWMTTVDAAAIVGARKRGKVTVLTTGRAR